MKALFSSLKSLLLLDLLQGLKVTLRWFFRPKVTLEYPEERAPKSVRFRGLHALRRYPNGEERCIACKLCEAVCPALAINIEAAPDDRGARRAAVYEIDLFKCIYCGFCEEACPVDAIVETHLTDYHFSDRGQHILDKEQLLAIGDHYQASITEHRVKDHPYR